jgi:hypothetical protein
LRPFNTRKWQAISFAGLEGRRSGTATQRQYVKHRLMKLTGSFRKGRSLPINQGVIARTSPESMTPANFDGTAGTFPARTSPMNVVMQYGQTYHANGWTIVANSDGTRFTNDATSHGMVVSIDTVEPF